MVYTRTSLRRTLEQVCAGFGLASPSHQERKVNRHQNMHAPSWIPTFCVPLPRTRYCSGTCHNNKILSRGRSVAPRRLNAWVVETSVFKEGTKKQKILEHRSSQHVFGNRALGMLCDMKSYDPDLVKWGLHLLDGGAADGSEIGLDTENDEAIARTLQEQQELPSLAENCSCSCSEHENEILGSGYENFNDYGLVTSSIGCSGGGVENMNREIGNSSSFSPDDNQQSNENDEAIAEALSEELAKMDGEVGRRLTHMESIPHVLRINGEIPSMDDASLDHERLSDRLHVYGLTEQKISGDGNCQFRALSDQLYRTPDHHMFVRKEVVGQLKQYAEPYEGYVPMKYSDYVRKMAKNGEWGDHVTLQAAADSYGIKICLLTSFRDTCFIEITPREKKSDRVIFLSFWAEVHYNSVYPEGEIPTTHVVKKKRHWLSFLR